MFLGVFEYSMCVLVYFPLSVMGRLRSVMVAYPDNVHLCSHGEFYSVYFTSFLNVDIIYL